MTSTSFSGTKVESALSYPTNFPVVTTIFSTWTRHQSKRGPGMVTECSQVQSFRQYPHTHMLLLPTHQTSVILTLIQQIKQSFKLVPSFKLFHMEVREYVNCLLHSSSWYFNWCFLQVPASLVFQMVKKSACNGDPGSIPGSEKSPQEAIDYPLPVFLLGEFHRQRSLAGYSPRGHKVGND